jgi:predicted transcriptional regulator
MISGGTLITGGIDMRTVTLEVSSRETTNQRFLSAFDGQPQGDVISFESPALLFKVLSGKRWEMLNIMTGSGPMAIRELARRMRRDVKAVHSDVHALLNAGIFLRTDTGQIVFPFDALHVDFVLKEAA